jgi:peroxiredoxin
LKIQALFVIVLCAVVALESGCNSKNGSGGSAASKAEAKLAPDFTLPDLSDKPLTLSSLRGKVVLLDFWATWCTPCREEIPEFVKLQDKYRDHGLQVIGISMDDGPEPVRDFYKKFQMNYPVVMGDAKTGAAYGGVLGLPIAFVIDQNGKILSRHIGATDVSVLEKEIVPLLPKSGSAGE